MRLQLEFSNQALNVLQSLAAGLCAAPGVTVITSQGYHGGRNLLLSKFKALCTHSAPPPVAGCTVVRLRCTSSSQTRTAVTLVFYRFLRTWPFVVYLMIGPA
jgi:hypothetical protein